MYHGLFQVCVEEARRGEEAGPPPGQLRLLQVQRHGYRYRGAGQSWPSEGLEDQ